MVFGHTWRSKPLEYLGEYYLNLYDVDKGYFHVYKEGRTFFLYPEELDESRPFMDFDKQERSYSIKVDNANSIRHYRDSTFVKRIKDEKDALYIKKANDLYKSKIISNGRGKFLSKKGFKMGNDLYVMITVQNLSRFDHDVAHHEYEMLKDCDSCVNVYGVYMIINPPIKEMETSTALVREDYIRLGYLKDYLDIDDAREIAYKIGKATLDMIESGYGHTSLHEDNIVIKKDEEFLVKITDGSDMYKLDKGDISHFIITREDGIRMTIASAILSSIRFLNFIDEKEKLVVDEFLKGLDVYDDRIAKEIKRRIDYIGDREIEIAGRICDKIVEEYFI
ncbi:MAG: hypothetical protein J7K83_01710 [Candidatus Aenigmarchaeota archaeon]|nr:hypothetical protein [Candidatus Aenigmarchaeota archaeon]